MPGFPSLCRVVATDHPLRLKQAGCLKSMCQFPPSAEAKEGRGQYLPAVIRNPWWRACAVIRTYVL